MKLPLLRQTAAVAAVGLPTLAHAQPQQPNSLFIIADDVGTWNLSTYCRGMMGGGSPNIDRLARDRNPYLPTVHGFDEFYESLCQLNSEEGPEDSEYPKNPQPLAMLGLRGLLDTRVSNVDDPTEDPRFGRVGQQTPRDSGLLTKERMEAVEIELFARSLDSSCQKRRASES